MLACEPCRYNKLHISTFNPEYFDAFVVLTKRLTDVPIAHNRNKSVMGFNLSSFADERNVLSDLAITSDIENDAGHG